MGTSFSRFVHLHNLWREGIWGKWLALAWFAYGAALQLRDGGVAILDPAGAARMIPLIAIHWWLIGCLVVALGWCFEASFRVQRATCRQLAQLEQALASPSRITREKMADHLAGDRLRLVDLLTKAISDVFTDPRARMAPVVTAEMFGLSARFVSDSEFSSRWVALAEVILLCHQHASVRPEDMSDEAWEARRADFRTRCGQPLLLARDELIAYLLKP